MQDPGHRRRSLSGFLTSSASHEWVRHGVSLSQIRAAQKCASAERFTLCLRSGGARQIARHERRDAAVLVEAQLLLRIDPAQRLDVLGFDIPGDDVDGQLLAGFKRGEAENADLL